MLERERMDTKDLLQAIGIAWKLKASKSFKHLTKILRTRDEKVTLKEYDDEDLCLTLLPEKVLSKSFPPISSQYSSLSFLRLH